jgi:magnesium transporter
MEQDIDSIEEDTFSSDSKTEIEQIYLIKREVVELRRAVSPLSVALARLPTDHKDLVSKEVLRYLRDVLDHATAAADLITSYDEMLTSLVQAASAKVGMEQNTDMRKISAWVAIAAVPTMIAGIYGMNFDNMPELHWVWGYPAVLTGMVVVCSLLYRNFRRNHWL